MAPRWLATMLVTSLLAGCAAPDGQVASMATVRCELVGEDGAPVAPGSCRFILPLVVQDIPVGASGQATAQVPVGVHLRLQGHAPGHAFVEAALGVERAVAVRLVLPLLPATMAPSQAPAQPQQASSPAASTPENGTAGEVQQTENATVETFEPVRDLLLDETYLIAPGDPPVVQHYAFEVDAAYDVLEVNGKYSLPAYAANLQLTIHGPDGSEVVSYNGLDAKALVTGTGGSDRSFPIGFVHDPAPGTYRVSVSGAGAPSVQVLVHGMAGLAPDFAFTDIADGATRHLSDYVGQVVVVDLMATWCGPCAAAMPGLADIRADYEGAVEVLSIGVDNAETEQELADFRDEHKADWVFGFEEGETASAAYGTGWIPTMVVVDAKGGLLFRSIGAVEDAQLRQLIDAALED